jgi:hypothetical protein
VSPQVSHLVGRRTVSLRIQNNIKMDENARREAAAQFRNSAATIGWFDADDGVLLLRTGVADEVLVSSLCGEKGTSSHQLLYSMDLQGEFYT